MTATAENAIRPVECLGHENVFGLFRRTLARGRLASTYLFVGEEGVGKRTAAFALARGLLCSNPVGDGLTPCGDCESCRLTAAGNHPDLLTVARPEGKSTLPIGLFVGDGDRRNREGLCHDIALKPMLGDRRIAIIDDADSLSIESGNCLLKTLEEPPPASLIVLIATGVSRVLPTIRSRCQVVRFGKLSDEAVAEALRRIASDAPEPDVKDFDAQDFDAAARAGRGSVSRALAAADEQLAAARPEIAAALNGADFDPVALAARLQEILTSGGADPATKRRRLHGIIDFAIETLREDLRTGPAAVDSALQRLDACFDTQQFMDRNANPATLVPWWVDRLWQASAR